MGNSCTCIHCRIGITMKLRVILSENDIRKLTLDRSPESVENLITIMKEKYSLDGNTDWVVQYEDPDFRNKLCNLDHIDELKDSYTIKLLAKTSEVNQESSSDSNDNSIVTTTVAVDPHLRVVKGCIPTPFILSEFSHQTELSLQQAMKVYDVNGTYYNPPRDVKSSIIESVAD